MRFVFAFLLSGAALFGQISGAGQLGCTAAPTTGAAWTSATALNTTQVLGTAVAGAQVLVTIDQTTTLTGGAIQFQGDPGDGNVVNLASWQVVDPTSGSLAQIAQPYTLQASTNKQFLILMSGYYKLVLKLTTAITGTGSITPFTIISCYPAPVMTQSTPANLNVTNQGALGNNGATAGTNRVGTLPGVVQTDPANGAAYTQGRDAAPNVDTAGNLWTSVMPGLRPASYHAAKNFAASSTTDNACIFGNATNTVLLYEVKVSGTQTTAGIVNVELVRRSAAETGGTSANFTSVRDDVTNYAAASTTPVSYTGTGPTVGTAVGDIDDAYTGFLAAATAAPDDIYIWNGKLKPQLLIGTTQGVCVNLGGALTGGNLSVSFAWEEIKNVSE